MRTFRAQSDTRTPSASVSPSHTVQPLTVHPPPFSAKAMGAAPGVAPTRKVHCEFSMPQGRGWILRRVFSFQTPLAAIISRSRIHLTFLPLPLFHSSGFVCLLFPLFLLGTHGSLGPV